MKGGEAKHTIPTSDDFGENIHVLKRSSPRHALENGFPGGSVVENPPANAGNAEDGGSIHGSGRSPRIGNGNPFQYSCLGNPMNRGAWQATIQGIAKQSDT